MIAETQTLLRTAVCAAVMTALFVGGYVIRRRWVFAPETNKERNERL